MPKAKSEQKTSSKSADKKVKAPVEEEKIIEIDTEVKELDPELIPGEEITEDEEDEAALDDDEVDPFKDKWEE